MAAGCLLFYPAASYRIFWVFLLGYFILAGGITILQVAANPYVTILGPEKPLRADLIYRRHLIRWVPQLHLHWELFYPE